MNLGRKLIHQISAGRFASSWRFVAGRGGDSRSSTGLSRASQFLEQNPRKIFWGTLLLAEYWRRQEKSTHSVIDTINESDKAMRRAMEEKGVTREFCEAKIAELKQKTESLSTSEHERFVLQIYEGWLQVLAKG